MTRTMYETVKDTLKSPRPDRAHAYWGEGTQFEAVGVLHRIDGDWWGYVLFKDERFSPPSSDDPLGLPFRHTTPASPKRARALFLAHETWEALVSLFQGLLGEEASDE